MLLVPKSRHFSHHRSPRTISTTTTTTTTGSSSAHGEDDHHQQMSAGIDTGSASGISGAAMATSKSASKDANAQLVTTTWFLRLCKLINIVTGMAAVLGIVAHLAVLSVPAPAADVALRFYGILLCILSILTECEWARLFSWLGILETWIGRGLNNIFCGVLVLVFDDTVAAVADEGEGKAARTWFLRSFAGYFLLSMGIIYVAGGFACLNRVKERHLSKLRKRDQALVQRQELESRKQEIELLLRETESQLEKI